MKKWLKICAITLITAFAVSVTTAFTVQAYQGSLIEPTAIVNAKSSKSDVKLVQQKLKNWGYYKGSVDGIYGSKTKAAVILFQSVTGWLPMV